jgi:5-methylcytosine-specific restriction enzyme A
MPLLYYWRGDNYYRDLDMGAGYHLNQANPLLHKIELGDSLWAFTRRRDGIYVLAAELIVKAKTINPPNFRYGKYRVWGDIYYSRYFQIENQPSIENVVRSLSCKINAEILGHSFQGLTAVKQISPKDSELLRMLSAELSLELRARILSEDKLEAMLLLGDIEAVKNLVRDERPGIAEARRNYFYKHAPTRNQKLVEELQEIYSGRCQVCEWNPITDYGKELCHGHHIQWLSRGGADEIQNMVLVCPNHHAAIHKLDAPLDYSDFSFDFGTHRENLILRNHLEEV